MILIMIIIMKVVLKILRKDIDIKNDYNKNK